MLANCMDTASLMHGEFVAIGNEMTGIGISPLSNYILQQPG